MLVNLCVLLGIFVASGTAIKQLDKDVVSTILPEPRKKGLRVPDGPETRYLGFNNFKEHKTVTRFYKTSTSHEKEKISTTAPNSDTRERSTESGHDRRGLDELRQITKREPTPLLPERYSKNINQLIKNADWKQFSTDDFSKTLQCEDIHTRAIHDVSVWNSLRKVYEDVVGEKRSSLAYMNKLIDSSPKEHLPPQDSESISIQYVPGKGRGLVASKDIKAGEHIYSHVNEAEFFTKEDLNQFLAVLPSHIACDIILWAFSVDEDPDQFHFSVYLGDGTYCNDGGSSGSNVEWKSGVFANFVVASRDIKAEEEILCDYGNYLGSFHIGNN